MGVDVTNTGRVSAGLGESNVNVEDKNDLDELRENRHASRDLQEELSGFKSLRSKRYRIIYDIDESRKTIQVYYVGRRRDVYEQFRRLLGGLFG